MLQINTDHHIPTIHNSRSLDAPPELVFDLMADHERYAEWVAIVEEATMVKGERIEAGAEYEEVSPLGPFDSTSHWRVPEFDPPRRQVHVGKLPFGPVELTVETQPDGAGGTILDHTVELPAFPELLHEEKTGKLPNVLCLSFHTGILCEHVRNGGAQPLWSPIPDPVAHSPMRPCVPLSDGSSAACSALFFSSYWGHLASTVRARTDSIKRMTLR